MRRATLIRRCGLVFAVLLLVGTVLVGTACSSSSSPDAKSGVTTTSVGNAKTARTARCPATTLIGADGAPNEIHGTSAGGSLWGLILGPGSLPPHAGDELKIVWRMTGTGPLRVVFTSPEGRRRPLVFGPEAHPVSTYRRPGDEWGTGFRFGVPGCWHIQLARTDTSGEVWLDVRA